MPTMTTKQLKMLVLLTLIWGINWPVMKYAVSQFPPLTYRWLSMLGGAMCITVYAMITQQNLRVPRQQWGKIVLLSIPNMLMWHIFCVLGVKELASGRAAIIAYTMPVWSTLTGVLFGVKVERRSWIGIALALSGTLLLLSSELGNLLNQSHGFTLMIIAAVSWGFGTASIRHWPTGLPTIAFTHVMLWVASVLMGVVVWVFEGDQLQWPVGFSQWWPLAYGVFGVFAYCHIAWFNLASSLPPVASGVSVMMIPVLGVFSGMLLLGEVPHWQDYGALLLIVASMVVVLVRRG